MRVAIFVNTFPSLSETFILNQIAYLIRSGVEVEIFARCPANDHVVHPEIEEFNLLERTHYWMPKPWMLPIIFVHNFVLLWKKPTVFCALLSHWRQWKVVGAFLCMSAFFSRDKNAVLRDFDIIHAHFGPIGTLCLLQREAGLIKGKAMTSFHGYDVHAYPCRFGKGAYRFLFDRCDFFSANSSFTAKHLMELGCSFSKIILIPESLDISKYHYVERSMPDDGCVNILTVARLVEKKGIEYSIKAFSIASRLHTNLRYWIVGDGPLMKRLEGLINELNLEKKVKIIGSKNSNVIRNFYRDAHIFVLASVKSKDGDMEGQGLVLQEAQASGIPVISTLHNGIPDGVLDGVTGFLVQEKDVESLSDKLNFLLVHPEHWKGLGWRGHTFVKERFDINKIGAKLLSIYQEKADDTISS